MNSTLHYANVIASWIPSKIRGVIYTLIGLFWAVDAIWHIIPENETGEKIALSISLVAALMAAVNTELVPNRELPAPDPNLRAGQDRGESTLMTIVLVLVIVVIALFLFGTYR